MLRIIAIDDLQPGMYVNAVTEQTGTLRIRTRGVVKTDKAIETLRQKGVLKLEVDDSRGAAPPSAAPAPAPSPTPAPSKQPASKPVKEQLEQATKLYEQAKGIHRGFLKRIEKEQQVDLDRVNTLSHDIIDSVFETPNALSCLSLMQKSDEYLLEHSLNCSILMAMFARHLEMDPQDLSDLAMGALLMDIGMANIPKDIMTKKGPLTETERDIVSTHVDVGLDIVERCGDAPPIVRDVIYNHHERIDGSGYPDKKQGDDVSLYARMAGIVDSYDAMISPRSHQNPIPATAALKSLLQNPGYDQGLVQKFVQCLGVHPVGSLVKLTNERLAIVIRANSKKPLQPTVATFYHLKSGHYAETKLLDLSKVSEEIERSVRPEEFGLNLTKFFREVFLDSLPD